MLTLRSSPASPFVRKVRIAASLLGLEREITLEHADPTNPSDTIRRQNPLGKIPALVLDDGTVLFDSRGDPRISRSSRRRRKDHSARCRRRASPRCSCRRCATASWMRRSCIIYEGRWRPSERHEPKWVDHQAGKVARALAALERHRRCSTAARMSARSRSPARWAIATSASAAAGARIIRGWSHGSTALPRGCRRSRPPHRRRDHAVGQTVVRPQDVRPDHRCRKGEFGR